MDYPKELKVVKTEDGKQNVVDENNQKRFGPFDGDQEIHIWENSQLPMWCVKPDHGIAYAIQGEKLNVE
jgi:hypothetical protein